MKDAVMVARVGAPHGVRGEVRVKPFTEDPADFAAYGPLRTADGRRFEVVSKRPQKTMMVARLRGVDTREAAEALNGVELFVDRAALPAPDDGEFYAVDLIGCEAMEDGQAVGRVKALEDFGAGDVLEIAGPDGTFWLDFTLVNVPDVDLAARRIVIVRPDEVSEREEGRPSPD